MNIQQHASSTDAPLVVGCAGRVGRIMDVVESGHGDRQATRRARDRGDTMIEIARMVTTKGGEVCVEAVEPDGARFTMTVAAVGSSELASPAPITARSEVLTPATALHVGDRAG